MITELDAVIPPPATARDGADASHPMRQVTRQVAFEPGGWTPERRAKVADLFDGLAAEWHTRASPGRLSQLPDALDRGLPAIGWEPPGGPGGGRCLELGSGSGLFTPVLVARFDRVVALDLAIEMLRRAPVDVGLRVQGDASALPVADGGADVVVLVNALLFPHEVDRVLAPDGAVVWVNSRGDRTPIHLPVADVAEALPGSWSGVASRADEGTWGVLRRDAVA